MADENNTDDAKAAADAKKKERAEKAAAKGLAGKKKTAEPTGPAPKYKREKTPRLKKKYEDAVRAAMMTEFSYKTPMQVPRVVKITVLVSSTPDFYEQHLVANGASNLLANVLGDAGKHARAAVGMASLPLNASVEIDAILEVA